MLRSFRRPLPRIGKWPRLLLFGMCLLLAAGSALGAKRGAVHTSRTVAVVVAARDLPAGRALTRHDLRIARWPAPVLPAGVRGDPAAVVGRRLSGPVAAGEAVP